MEDTSRENRLCQLFDINDKIATAQPRKPPRAQRILRRLPASQNLSDGLLRLNDDGSHRVARTHQIPLASHAAEFLAPDHAGGQLYDTRRVFQLHNGAEPIEGWDTLVSPPSSLYFAELHFQSAKLHPNVPNHPAH